MGRAVTFRFLPHAMRKLQRLDCLIDCDYDASESWLDNKRDPLDEAIYIILSFQTDVTRLKRVWSTLKNAYPQGRDVARTPVSRLAAVLGEGGLQVQKARTIKRLLSEVRRRSGDYTLDDLRSLDSPVLEALLTGLPGLSWKGARCVMLYSFDRNVFPVDTNTFRVFRRAGILPSNAVYRRRRLHDKLQSVVPPDRRRRFHVNLVVHGQRVCLPNAPRCNECLASQACDMRGIPWSRAMTWRQQTTKANTSADLVRR